MESPQKGAALAGYDLIVIGGGAAGLFAAIQAKQNHPEKRVALFEKTAVLLAKVKVSGGGRCNVTHACFSPKELCKNYPRGAKELLGPFHLFQPRDTIEWFAARGVPLKTEADGRIFPTTDSSETIIHCLLHEAKKLGVEIHTLQRILEIAPGFTLTLADKTVSCKSLLLATGSGKDGYAWAKSLGHTIVEPVPSLFTLNVPRSPLKELSGITVEPAEIGIAGTSLVQRGALLLTHFGFSGPAALKLSAWGARVLCEKGYRSELHVNWLPLLSQEELLRKLLQWKTEAGQKQINTENPFYLPKNLWRLFVSEKRLCDVSHKELQVLAQRLHRDPYQMEGKTTHKEEFVTCGGISLKEVDFRTMQSKICPNLYFAGEILDIDGVTGGFNFQNAWTTGFIAASHLHLV